MILIFVKSKDRSLAAASYEGDGVWSTGDRTTHAEFRGMRTPAIRGDPWRDVLAILELRISLEVESAGLAAQRRIALSNWPQHDGRRPATVLIRKACAHAS